MILKMMKELGRRMDTQREKLEVCKEFENIKNNQIEMKLVFFSDETFYQPFCPRIIQQKILSA